MCRQESLGVNRADQVGDPRDPPRPSPRGPKALPGLGRFLIPQPEGLWSHSPSPAEELLLLLCSAQSQEEVPSSQGGFWSTNGKGELRLSPAEENLRADPSGEHSTSQFRHELELWPGMLLKSPLQTKRPTKPFGLLGLLTQRSSKDTWTTQGAEPPPPRGTHDTQTTIQIFQNWVLVSPGHPRGVFGKGG